MNPALEGWFDELGVRPEFVGEFDDSALLKAFREDGFGLFAAPAVVHRELQRQYGIRRLGLAGTVRETFYAVTAERRVKHPAVVLLTEAARERGARYAHARSPGPAATARVRLPIERSRVTSQRRAWA